ncbi:septum formation family protein [Micromonospora sp. NPDC005298]|uniref:septum formation family protein n=1 Tax=Micromonospora sp. NPDC005298 TaxID=3156873 RepID=UPI0033A388DD
MRRQVMAAVAAAFSAVMVAGCGTPAGTDGDLSDDWRPMARAQQFVPKAGECHTTADPTAYLTSYAPVDCAATHLVETFHLGTFTGALAARTVPPVVESAPMRPIFADCDERAKQFVGGEWRNARLSVRVTPASLAGWSGGARWYRCDIVELDEVNGPNGESDAAIQRVGSLRGALATRSPLMLGCMNEDKWGMLRAVACTSGHQFEYAGIWTAPDRSWKDATSDEGAIHTACRTVIARFAKVPVDAKLPYRTGTAYRFPTRLLWERGDRGVRCYYWSSGTTVKRSIAGGGTAALPLR